MYHKHNTEGIVVGGWERGDASRSVAIFSKEFGLIYATAQNARALNSKLRYSIQDYTLGNFVLVKGKHSWKLVGAEGEKNIWATLDDKEKQNLLSNIFILVRSHTGEEKDEELYKILKNFAHTLELTSKSDIKSLESLTVLKILHNLGFVKENLEEIEKLSVDRLQATKVINESLRAAQLML